MVKILIYIIFLLAICGLMYCCLSGVRASRYGTEERFLHCRYLAAFLLLIVVLCNRYTFAYILILVDKIINCEALSQLWNLVLPMRRFEMVYMILCLLLCNFLMIIAAGLLFMIVKFLFRNHKGFINVQGTDLFHKLKHIPWIAASHMYEETDEDGVYRVTNRGFTMSLWAGRMKLAFIVFEMLEILFLSAGVFSDKEFYVNHAIILAQGWYLLPMAGYILMEQIQYFLEGRMESDVGSFGSEDISDRLEGNMEALIYLYMETFRSSGALMSAYAWKDMKVIRDGLIHNGLTNDQIDECLQPEILCMLNNQMKESGIRQNIAFQNALIALLNGLSINVRDHIQGEFLIYLAAYMNFFISQEKTFLVLCQSKKKACLIKKALENALNQINKIHSIWQIADIDEADSNEEMSILVCSCNDLVTHKIVDKRQDFFSTLSGVVLTDSLEFCAQNNVQKKLIFSEFGKIRQKLQYILLSEDDNDSLRTTFEYYTNEEIIPYKNDQLQNNTFVMIWEEDSYNKIQRCINIGEDQSPYMGVSIPLALVAARYDLPKINIFTSDDKGYYTYQDVMKMSYQEIIRYLGWNLNLEKMIRYNHFMDDSSELEMLILYDSEYNFYNLLWAWMKYGGKNATMIHIVSPPYMLREFFAANLKTLILKNNDFDALISHQSGLKHTRFLSLLLELSKAGIDEDELMKKNREYGWNYATVTELLSDCLKNVLNEQEFYNIYECFKFEEYCLFDLSDDQFRQHTLVRLTDETIRRRIQEKLAFAQLVTKNNVMEELPVLKGDVFNYYLKGQIIALNGYMQRIINVNDGMVFAEQTITQDRKLYFQACEFIFRNMRKTDECVDFDILDFNLYTADVERNIYGYWSSNRAISFTGEGEAKLNNICDADGSPCMAAHDNLQILQIRMKKSCFSDACDRVALLAGFMFQELFKTLFPKNYMNLFAVIEYNPEKQYWASLINNSGGASLDDKIHSIVPFIRRENTDKDYINLYIVEFNSLEMGMITSLNANRLKLFQMSAAYLSWYLNNSENHSASPENDAAMEKQAEEQQEERNERVFSPKEASYLNLGYQGIAPCFAPRELLEFCKKVLPVYEEHTTAENDTIEVKKECACDFCGKAALFTYRMSDGRKMCRSCKQQQIGQKDEIKELYMETVVFLCTGYHIKLRKNIHLHFQSADTIRKHCKSSGGGRVLGFYQNKNHELWIESRGPRNAVQDTIIHELTHAWQFDNMNIRKLYKKHPKEALKILEGHASYMEVDAMRRLGEEEYAAYLEKGLMARKDEYGEGFRLLKEYLEEKESEGSHWTPYEAMKALIDNL